MFGFEESFGYLSGTDVRDKDGVNACMLIAEAASWYKKDVRQDPGGRHRHAV